MFKYTINSNVEVLSRINPDPQIFIYAHSKEMESEDIEDGEILEDESNEGEEPCQPVKEKHEEKNNFERFFSKEKRNHHHRPQDHQESHKSFRRDRSAFPPSMKKRKRSDEDVYRSDKYHGKVKCMQLLEITHEFRSS